MANPLQRLATQNCSAAWPARKPAGQASLSLAWPPPAWACFGKRFTACRQLTEPF